MSTVRQHLAKTWGDLAALHKKHGAACEDGDPLKEYHNDMEDCYKSACAECTKAASDDLEKGNRIVPDGVRLTIPSDTPDEGFRANRLNKAVTRVGQPELVNREGIPEELKFFTEIQE